MKIDWFIKTEIGKLVLSWITFVLFGSLANVWEWFVLGAWISVVYWAYFIIRSSYEGIKSALKERKRQKERDKKYKN